MDEPLGLYRELSAVSRLAGSAALLGSLALTVALQRLQLELKRADTRRWWASNGRDLINLLAFGALGGSLLVVGFPAPAALLLGATMLLVLQLFEALLLNWPRLPAPTALSLGVAFALACPVLLSPNRVFGWVSRATEFLFP